MVDSEVKREHDERSLLTEMTKNDVDSESIKKAKKYREYALRELVKSEERYVESLSLIVQGYLHEIRNPRTSIPIPEDLLDGKLRMVFSNIEEIYEWHITFVKLLQNCLQNNNELGPLFMRSKQKLKNMYVKYSRNKIFSEYITTEHRTYFEKIQTKCNHSLSVNDLLIEPVQRISRYTLLLERILNYSRQAELVQEVSDLELAIDVMKSFLELVNDMVDVHQRLQNFTENIAIQGDLLLKSVLMCTEAGDYHRSVVTARKLQVILFEKCIIFAKINSKMNGRSTVYLYKNHILTNKMKLIEVRRKRNLLIHSTDTLRPECSFTIEFDSDEQFLQWKNTLKKILQDQLLFLEEMKAL